MKNKIIWLIVVVAFEMLLLITCIVEFVSLGRIVFLQTGNYLNIIYLIVEITIFFTLAGLGIAAYYKNKSDYLKKENSQLEALTANVPGGVVCLSSDKDFTISHMSDSLVTLTGYSREEIAINFDNKFIKMVYPKDRDMFSVVLDKKKNDTYELQFRIIKKTGEILWILDNGKVIYEKNKFKHYSVLVDISESKKAEQEIEKNRKEIELSNERYKIILDQSDSIIFEYDVIKNEVYFSNHFFDKFGYYASEYNFPNSFLSDMLVHQDDMDRFALFFKKIHEGVHFVEDEYRIISVVNGIKEYIWCRAKATAIFNENEKVVKAIGRFEDVSKVKAEKMRLLTANQVDTITGLLNKQTFEMFTDTAISENKDMTHAILIIDIKDFDTIKDIYGIDFSRIFLSDFAKKLDSLFRSSDILGRISGDVFAVFMKSPTGSIITHKIHEIADALKEVTPDNYVEELFCNIGIAMYPKDAANAEDLYNNAEKALLSVKNKNGIWYGRYGEVL